MTERATTLAAVVVTGCVTLAVQVIVPRMLHPIFGSGNDVASAVVALSLAGLSLGYFFGASLPGRVGRNLPAALLVGGLWYLALSRVWPSLPVSLGARGAPALLLVTVFTSALPATALGLVPPLAVRALRPAVNDRPSSTPGVVFAVGTLANVVGGLAAGFWLVPFVGLSRSLSFLGGALVVCASAVAVTHRGTVQGAAAAGPGPGPDPGTDRCPASAQRPRFGLLALAFYSGVASLAIEVSGARMLSSNFGPTTALWASVLAVSLGGLAIGYGIGGRIRASAMRVTLPIIVATNSIWLLLSAWFIWVAALSVTSSDLSAMVVITVVGFLPTFVLFGIESQLIVGLVGANLGGRQLADVTGKVFAVSTVGGLLGALSGVLFLLPTLGISVFVRIAAAGYVIVAAAALPGRRRLLGVIAAVSLVAPLPNWRWPDRADRLVAQREGRYQTIRIYTDDRTYLRFNLGPTFESEVALGSLEPRFGYARTILSLAGDVSGRRVLVIGGAGHAVARAFEQRGATVTEVEIDPLVIQMSDRHFAPINGTVVSGDGRRFVTNADDAGYDIVVLDAFDGPRVVPPHLTTREFFSQVQRVLDADGTMYMNMIGNVEGAGSESYEALSSTIADVFPRAARNGNAGNIVLIGANGEPPALQPATAVVRTPITDDLNPIEILINRSR